MKPLVSFFLDLDQQTKRSGRYDGARRDTVADILAWTSKIFGLSDQERRKFYEVGSAEIICTTHQFTDFLIERASRGYCNSFRELKVKFVIPQDSPGPLILRAKGTWS